MSQLYFTFESNYIVYNLKSVEKNRVTYRVLKPSREYIYTSMLFYLTIGGN